MRRKSAEDVPILLTFGETVYVSDARYKMIKINEVVSVSYISYGFCSFRFSIKRSKGGGDNGDDWILGAIHAKSEDEGIYECHVSTEPPQIRKIYLAVEGE